MKISEKSISGLARVITGDSGISPYRSGPQLVKFFNEFGFNDVYGSGFPSRWYFAEERLRGLNDKPAMRKVIEVAIDRRNFLGTSLDINVTVEHLREYLNYDGYDIVDDGKFFRVRELSGGLVEYEPSLEAASGLNSIFVDEQVLKCKRKISEGDFDGAITNARTLIEAVLLEIDKQTDEKHEAYDGDLPKLFKKVQRSLNLDPARKDISDTLRQVLSGLGSMVIGLAALRNKMSDAHATDVKPSKHQAKLAVNAAKTLADFLVESFSSGGGKQ